MSTRSGGRLGFMLPRLTVELSIGPRQEGVLLFVSWGDIHAPTGHALSQHFAVGSLLRPPFTHSRKNGLDWWLEFGFESFLKHRKQQPYSQQFPDLKFLGKPIQAFRMNTFGKTFGN